MTQKSNKANRPAPRALAFFPIAGMTNVDPATDAVANAVTNAVSNSTIHAAASSSFGLDPELWLCFEVSGC